MLIRNDGFGPGHTAEILDVRGKLVLGVKFPKGPGNEASRANISWKSRTLVGPPRASAVAAFRFTLSSHRAALVHLAQEA